MFFKTGQFGCFWESLSDPPLYLKLDILPMKKLFIYRSCLYIYKSGQPTRTINYRTRFQELGRWHPPRQIKSSYSASFDVTSRNIYNYFIEMLHSINSINLFKSQIKSKLTVEEPCLNAVVYGIYAV